MVESGHKVLAQGLADAGARLRSGRHVRMVRGWLARRITKESMHGASRYLA